VVPGIALGPAGGEHRVATDVGGLLADLHHATHDHVVDHHGIDARALDQRLQRLRREVDGMPVLELAVAPAERRANGIDDDGGGHGGQSDVRLPGHPNRSVRSVHPRRSAHRPWSGCTEPRETRAMGTSLAELDDIVAGTTTPRLFLRLVATTVTWPRSTR
jgi:hypothetical protein